MTIQQAYLGSEKRHIVEFIFYGIGTSNPDTGAFNINSNKVLIMKNLSQSDCIFSSSTA